jgi:hypothetical protein
VANNIVSNPWILDTVTAAVLLPMNMKVHHFEFVGYATNTDTCQVQDGHGNVVWQGNAAADLEEVRSGNVGWIHNGLRLSQISSGQVRVFLA